MRRSFGENSKRDVKRRVFYTNCLDKFITTSGEVTIDKIDTVQYTFHPYRLVMSSHESLDRTNIFGTLKMGRLTPQKPAGSSEPTFQFAGENCQFHTVDGSEIQRSPVDMVHIL